MVRIPRFPKLLATVALAAVIGASALGAPGMVRSIKAYPSACVADGRQPVTITAEVFDTAGRRVPNGTRVRFTSTLAQFREDVVETRDGVAQVIMIASSVPGVDQIQASVEGGGNVTPFRYRFAATQAELDSQLDYIEIASTRNVQFVPGASIIAAAAPDRGVSVRFHGIQIEADDLQIQQSYKVIARNAKLTINRQSKVFQELVFNLEEESGFGLTSVDVLRPDSIVVVDYGIFLGETQADDTVRLSRPVSRLGYVEINGLKTKPWGQRDVPSYQFEDISFAPASVLAKKAVVFPGNQIQFHRAELFVEANRVMRLPLYVWTGAGGSESAIAADIVSIQNNQIAVNYPYYTELKPGRTSLFRLRTGDIMGRGLSTNSGVFLDYEMAWNKGASMDGGLTIGGIGRQDLSVGLRQSIRSKDGTSVFAEVSVPANSSLMGSTTINRQFSGFSATIGANAQRNLRGLSYESQSANLALDANFIRLGSSPFRMSYGLVSEVTQQRTISIDPTSGVASRVRSFSSGTGLSWRLQGDSRPLDKFTRISSGLVVNRYFGSNNRRPLSLNGSLRLTSNISSRVTTGLDYSYVKDGFSDRTFGNHRVRAALDYNDQRASVSASLMRALDNLAYTRYTFLGDARYRLGRSFVLSYSHTVDRALGEEFLDQSVIFGYIIGSRQVGLSWSNRTKRIGIQLLGASF